MKSDQDGLEKLSQNGDFVNKKDGDFLKVLRKITVLRGSVVVRHLRSRDKLLYGRQGRHLLVIDCRGSFRTV